MGKGPNQQSKKKKYSVNWVVGTLFLKKSGFSSFTWKTVLFSDQSSAERQLFQL